MRDVNGFGKKRETWNGLREAGLEAPLPLWNVEVEKGDVDASLVTGSSSRARAAP